MTEVRRCRFCFPASSGLDCDLVDALGTTGDPSRAAPPVTPAALWEDAACLSQQLWECTTAELR